MKWLYLGLLSFFILSCGSNDPTGAFIVKEELQKSSYYISDSCYKGNEYAKYEFFDESYKKTIYKEPELKSVDMVIEDRIDYLNMLQIFIYESDNIFDCTVARNDEHSVTLVCINRAFKDSSYSFIRTLWDSKELALKNRDYDCDNY